MSQKRIIVTGITKEPALGCIKYLLEAGENILGVVCYKKDNQAPSESLKLACEKLGLKVYQPDNINSQEFIAELKKLESDFIFSLLECRIFKKEFIKIPKEGAINMHYGLLPKYRGCWPLEWQILNGEKYAGVSLHYVDDGIDTGDIIAQRKVEISDGDTASSLHEKCSQAGFELFKEIYPLLKEEKAERISQDNKDANYYKLNSLDFSKNSIDWSNDAEKIHREIQAFSNFPLRFMMTFHNQNLIIPIRTKVIAKQGAPGEILDINEEGILAGAGKNALLIERIMTGDILEYGKKKNINIGDFLQNKVINGREIAEQLIEELKQKIERLNLKLCLAIIQIGEDSAASLYIKSKEKICKKLGIEFKLYNFPDSSNEEIVIQKIKELNEDKAVNGIIIQLPLPPSLQNVIKCIFPEKDIDGLNSSKFVPAVAKAVLKILDKMKLQLDGKQIVIVGAGFAGQQIAKQFAGKNIKICDENTKYLSSCTLGADILISAVGCPNLIKKEMINFGAIVIDVGTNLQDNKLVGDVDFEKLRHKASAITPVPGGVGPVNVAMLIENLIEAGIQQES